LSSDVVSIAPKPELRPAEPYRWTEWLGNLLARELVPSPRKLRIALRITTIATVGAALITICHVNNEIGTYLVWLLVGAGPMMSVRRAGTLLAAEGVALAASVAIARVLAETPWLMLPFIFALFAWSSYYGNRIKLGAGLLLIEVVCLNLYYSVIFAPHEIGWAAAGAFGGSVIALGTVLLFDQWLWPEPSETLLREALANSLRRVRARLKGAVDFYLGHPDAVRPPVPPLSSDLPGHMTLLDQVVAEGVDVHRQAILLATITRIARIELEVNRLIIAVREHVPTLIRSMLQTEMQAAVDAIATALDDIVDELGTTILVGSDNPPPISRSKARLAMDRLRARILEVRPIYIGQAGAAEIENLASVTDSLASICGHIELLLDEPPASTVLCRVADATPQSRGLDPTLLRYALKVGLCALSGYLIGIFSQRPELSTILTTVLITALPTYGAAFRKMVLRIVGAVIGGAVSLLAIIIVSPNFESLPAYLITIFIVFYVSAYSSLGSGRVAYAGKQIGTTFALVFAGLSPSTDIYGPLWRVWAILLGTVVVAVIALILWPDYAGDSLIPRLRRVIAGARALAPDGIAAGSEGQINSAIAETMSTLAEMLQIADDAQIEGRTSTVDHNAIIEATGTLRRIANRFASISVSRLVAPSPELDPITESARRSFLQGTYQQLEAWGIFFGSPNCLDAVAARALASTAEPLRLEEDLREFETRLQEDGFSRIAAWTFVQRRALLAELSSLHRIAVLLPELIGWLARIPGQHS